MKTNNNMQKVFIDNKGIGFFVINSKGKIVNTGDVNKDTWENTYVELETIEIGEKLKLSFNKGIHKRVDINEYQINNQQVAFDRPIMVKKLVKKEVVKNGIKIIKEKIKLVQKTKEIEVEKEISGELVIVKEQHPQFRTFVGNLWRGYKEDTYTELNYKTTKIEYLDTDDNFIYEQDIIIKDKGKLEFFEKDGIITVFYDDYVLGTCKRWYDSEMNERQYLTINNTIHYLDTMPYFVEKTISYISSEELRLNIINIEKLSNDTKIKAVDLDNKKLPYGIVVGEFTYSYKSLKMRDLDYNRLKFLFIQFFF